jgi:hypothetical protein
MKITVLWVVTVCCSVDVYYVSEERIASIFRVEDQRKPACRLLAVGFLLHLLFDPEHGDKTSLQNVGGLSPAGVYGVITQNIGPILVFPVRISNTIICVKYLKHPASYF